MVEELTSHFGARPLQGSCKRAIVTGRRLLRTDTFSRLTRMASEHAGGLLGPYQAYVSPRSRKAVKLQRVDFSLPVRRPLSPRLGQARSSARLCRSPSTCGRDER